MPASVPPSTTFVLPSARTLMPLVSVVPPGQAEPTSPAENTFPRTQVTLHWFDRTHGKMAPYKKDTVGFD